MAANTLQEILDRIEELAYGVASDASVNPLIDSEVTAYTLFPHIVRFVIRQKAKRGDNIENLRKEVTVTVQPNGIGTLPDSVIREGLKHSYLAVIATYPMSSWVPYPDYGRYLYSSQIQYYSTRDDKFYFKINPLAIPDAPFDILLQTPAIPDLPADLATSLTLPQALIEDVIVCGAAVLRGEIPLASVMDENLQQEKK